MKVCYFTENNEKDKDGVSRVINKLEELNSKNGIETLYVCSVPGNNDNLSYFQTRSLAIPGYDGYRMSIEPAYFITKFLKQFNPDLIHIHAPFSLGAAGTVVARRLGIPCISTYHTHFVSYLKYHNAQVLVPLLNLHARSLYNKCDLNLIPSIYVQKYLAGIGVERTEVLPHGVDNKVFNYKYHDTSFNSEYGSKTLFLFVGRLVWEKNLRVMSKVFNKLYSERNDFELLIIGTGPAEEELKCLLPKANYLGFKTGKELSKIYASCDVFVFPSDTETFGNVIIEAMASGLPCLVADGGGSADIVRHNIDGFKFKADSEKEFYEYAQILLENVEIRNKFKDNVIKRSTNFSWEAVHKKMLSFYYKKIEEKKLSKVS